MSTFAFFHFQASKRSRIGQALLSAALKESGGNFEDEKRSHITLRPKSMSPREMVLDSVRFPKRKGKRAADDDDENLMDLQEHATEHATGSLILNMIITMFTRGNLFNTVSAVINKSPVI